MGGIFANDNLAQSLYFALFQDMAQAAHLFCQIAQKRHAIITFVAIVGKREEENGFERGVTHRGVPYPLVQ